MSRMDSSCTVLWRSRPCCLHVPHLPGPTKRTGSSCDRGALMSRTTTSITSPTRIQLQGVLSWRLQTLPLQVLVDSGSDDSFIDISIVNQTHIPTLPLPAPKEVFALDGRLLAHVTHHTVPLSLLLSGNHSEKNHLPVIPSPQSPVVLGLHWLKLHKPQIDWSLSRVVGWSIHCHATCLHSAASSCTQEAPACPTR